jgi:hypothetical protein
MSDLENFLSRWSRRKREVLRETETVIQRPETARDRPAEKDRVSGKGLPRSALASPEPIFDPASLPPIQSITAETDIRGLSNANMGAPTKVAETAWAAAIDRLSKPGAE